MTIERALIALPDGRWIALTLDQLREGLAAFQAKTVAAGRGDPDG